MTNPPAQLLQRVLWTCGREVYADAAAFDAAIRQYYRDLDVDLERWRGDDLVLAAPRVHVQFMCWENDDQVEPRLLLEASDPAGFTALDLLAQTHNAIARYLREHDATLGDHRFFEGLSAAAGDREVPLYFVDFGS